MKPKEIKNLPIMDMEELRILFMKWFSDGFTGEEGCVLYNIFVDEYFLHLPTQKIIDVGGTSFGSYLSGFEKVDVNWLWFHENCHHKIKNIKKKDIKRIHKIVDCEIELIDDKNEIKLIENMKWKTYRNSFHPGQAEWIEEKEQRMEILSCIQKCLGE